MTSELTRLLTTSIWRSLKPAPRRHVYTWSRSTTRSSNRSISSITNWHESDIITDRKSRFQARHVELHNPDDIPSVLDLFLGAHKSIAKNASHPHIIAWRVGDLVPQTTNKETKLKKSKQKQIDPIPLTYSNIRQGFQDNGESGAGSRLLQVLESNNFVNVLVIVTRWYGGSPIGSLRFRHINRVAMNTLRLKKDYKYQD